MYCTYVIEEFDSEYESDNNGYEIMKEWSSVNTASWDNFHLRIVLGSMQVRQHLWDNVDYHKK